MELQKKWILGILILTCLTAAVLILTIPQPVDSSLKSLDSIDKEITRSLTQYKTIDPLVRVSSITVDSIFTRKHYHITVNRDFPVTAFHASLALPLQEKKVTVSGKRNFPERSMHLRFIYGTKVVRTLEIHPTL
jgi:hypothetical protein